MDLFFDAMRQVLDSIEARMDKATAAAEVTEQRAVWADSMFGVLPQEQQLEGWE